MRLWSISLTYLDPRGIVALWREAILAKEVLDGKTAGYKNHPQLQRFRNSPDQKRSINTYLHFVYEESKDRGYNFDRSKFNPELVDLSLKIPVSYGQLEYEFLFLKHKLEKRNPGWLAHLGSVESIEPMPLFYKIEGPVAQWERPKEL